MSAAKRRADAADKTPAAALDVPELSDSQQKVVDEQIKLHERAEIAVNAASIKIMQSVYDKRRAAVKALPRFWGTALAQHEQLVVFMAGPDDMKALSHLTDLWLEYDPVEPRAFTINFEFSENPYFSDKVLKKEYKYTPPKNNPTAGAGVDANGVSDAQAAFQWDSHITPAAIKINWKDDGHNLTKLFPRVVSPDDPEDIEEFGSFFSFFEDGPDSRNIGPTIVEDFYPEALQYYLGENRAMLDSDDDMDSDDEDDDDDDEEIDLEQPRRKKAKQA